jgi:hypothetical protein
VALAGGALGVEGSSSAAVSRTCSAALLLGLFPLAGAERVQRRGLRVGAGVAVMTCNCDTGT